MDGVPTSRKHLITKGDSAPAPAAQDGLSVGLSPTSTFKKEESLFDLEEGRTPKPMRSKGRPSDVTPQKNSIRNYSQQVGTVSVARPTKVDKY